MKKLLILFVILDFAFVGIVLGLFSENERTIASLDQVPNLTDGQTQKMELIKSLKFSATGESVVLQTDLLQSLCASYTLVELRFKAINVAFSGQQPLITNVFSCAEVIKDPGENSLRTTFADFRSLQQASVLKRPGNQLQAKGIYSDEELPNEWVLYEIAAAGELNFTISEVELNEFLDTQGFKFSLPIF